jgi:hypothetical protein
MVGGSMLGTIGGLVIGTAVADALFDTGLGDGGLFGGGDEEAYREGFADGERYDAAGNDNAGYDNGGYDNAGNDNAGNDNAGGWDNGGGYDDGGGWDGGGDFGGSDDF